MTEIDPAEIDRAAIRAMRRSYGEQGLSEESVLADPIKQFQLWLKQAAENQFIVEPNAMVLSTVSENAPTSRTVLLKDVDNEGFTFFTNYESRKSQQISNNANVSLLFPWYSMERQVIVLGTAKKISEQESKDYFATRPWSSQTPWFYRPLVKMHQLQEQYYSKMSITMASLSLQITSHVRVNKSPTTQMSLSYFLGTPWSAKS